MGVVAAGRHGDVRGRSGSVAAGAVRCGRSGRARRRPTIDRRGRLDRHAWCGLRPGTDAPVEGARPTPRSRSQCRSDRVRRSPVAGRRSDHLVSSTSRPAGGDRRDRPDRQPLATDQVGETVVGGHQTRADGATRVGLDDRRAVGDGGRHDDDATAHARPSSGQFVRLRHRDPHRRHVRPGAMGGAVRRARSPRSCSGDRRCRAGLRYGGLGACRLPPTADLRRPVFARSGMEHRLDRRKLAGDQLGGDHRARRATGHR